MKLTCSRIFGSTRELEDVWRDEAEALGLINPSDTVEPTAEQDFNDQVQAGVENFPADRTDDLELMLGDRVMIENGNGDVQPGKTRHRNFEDLGLSSAKNWKAVQAPDKENPTRVRKQLEHGFETKTVDGKKALFNRSETLSHLDNRKDTEQRLERINWAIETLHNPVEIWKQDKQSTYVQVFDDPRGASKFKGCMVAVKDNNEVKTWFVREPESLDRARQGISYHVPRY